MLDLSGSSKRSAPSPTGDELPYGPVPNVLGRSEGNARMSADKSLVMQRNLARSREQCRTDRSSATSSFHEVHSTNACNAWTIKLV